MLPLDAAARPGVWRASCTPRHTCGRWDGPVIAPDCSLAPGGDHWIHPCGGGTARLLRLTAAWPPVVITGLACVVGGRAASDCSLAPGNDH